VRRDPAFVLVNPHAYVLNSPLKLVDPSGLGAITLGLTPMMDVAPLVCDAIEQAKECIDNEKKTAWSLSEKTGLPGRTGGKRDAFRHCLGSCKIEKKCGHAAAWVAGTGHEIWDRTFSPILRYPGQSRQDLHNNAVGRELGRSPGAKGKQCHDMCMGALQKGDLQAQAGSDNPNVYDSAAGGVPAGPWFGGPPW
jgi:hypothetical protein